MSNDTYGYDSGAEAGAIIAVVVMGILYVAMIAFGIYLYMRIARKAGWTLWHGLLVLVPLANLVFIIMFAFTEWPIERRLREAEARLALAGGGTAYGYPAPYGAPQGYGTAQGYGTTQAYGGAYPAAPYGEQPVPAAPYGGDPTAPAAPYGGEQQAPPSEPAAPLDHTAPLDQTGPQDTPGADSNPWAAPPPR